MGTAFDYHRIVYSCCPVAGDNPSKEVISILIRPRNIKVFTFHSIGGRIDNIILVIAVVHIAYGVDHRLPYCNEDKIPCF